MTAPLWFRWDGRVLWPMLPRLADHMNKMIKAGDICQINVVADRSMRSHGHFFAVLQRAWASLPEADRINAFPSSEHLRKWALSHTPYCTMRMYTASNAFEAQRLAKFLAGNDIQYSRIETKGRHITQFIPDSQALDAMPDSKIFQASKDAVFDVLAQHLGIVVEELEGAA